MSPKISDLPHADPRSTDDISFPVANATKHTNEKVGIEAMASILWDRMYINVRKVIVICPWCGCGNVVTNPACIHCGGPLGKV